MLDQLGEEKHEKSNSEDRSNVGEEDIKMNEMMNEDIK